MRETRLETEETPPEKTLPPAETGIPEYVERLDENLGESGVAETNIDECGSVFSGVSEMDGEESLPGEGASSTPAKPSGDIDEIVSIADPEGGVTETDTEKTGSGGSGVSEAGRVETSPSETGEPPFKVAEAASPSKVEVRNGYKYTLDELGRTTCIEGDLVSNSTQGRNRLAQLQAGGVDRLVTDEGGHFIGRRFDGPLDAFNHFAQDINLNRGAYKSLENSWQQALGKGFSVNVKINPNYTEASLRPDSLDVTYTINDVPYKKTFLNRNNN